MKFKNKNLVFFVACIFILFFPVMPIKEDIEVEQVVSATTTTIKETWEESLTGIELRIYPKDVHLIGREKVGSENLAVVHVIVGSQSIDKEQEELFESTKKKIHRPHVDFKHYKSILFVNATTVEPVSEDQSWNYNYTIHFQIKGDEWKSFGKGDIISEEFSLKGNGTGNGNYGWSFMRVGYTTRVRTNGRTVYDTFRGEDYWIFPHQLSNGTNAYKTEHMFCLNEEKGVKPKVTVEEIDVDHDPIYTIKRKFTEEVKPITKTEVRYIEETVHVPILEYILYKIGFDLTDLPYYPENP